MTKSIKQKKRQRGKQINNAILKFAYSLQESEAVELSICRKRRKAKRLLTTLEAAKLLGRRPKTLCNWRNIGHPLRYFKVGGNVLYERKDVLAFLNSRKFNSTSEYYAPLANEEVK